MNLLAQIRKLLKDPPPEYAFEVSEAGIAWARQTRDGPQTGFEAIEPGVLAVSPLRDNVADPDAFFRHVKALAPANGKGRRRRAALILPDFCARVAVLDFDQFPSDAAEQLSLVRFRMKKSIPFDVDSAQVAYYVQARGGGRSVEVVAAVAPLEIIARYEAAFRSAGFEPGLVITSTLAALNLLEPEGVQVLARLSGAVLTAAVTEGRSLRLLRCVELPELTPEEVMRVLFPTCAFVEDTLGSRPRELLLCGFGEWEPVVAEQSSRDLGLEVRLLRSSFGEPGQANAGLLGFLAGAQA